LIGQDESHYYTIMVSCLFGYYPLWWYLKNKHGLEKGLINLIISLIYFMVLKLSPAVDPLPLGGHLSDAGAWQLLGFNFLSGLPMVVLGSYLIPWLVSADRTINLPQLGQAIGGLMGLWLIDYLLYHYWFTTPVTTGFPPMLRQTWVGALVVLLALGALQIWPRAYKPLATLGQRSLLHFWTLWLGGTLIVAWNGVGKYQFSGIGASLGLLLIITLYTVVINFKPKPQSGTVLKTRP
jgi:hypothetical protein